MASLFSLDFSLLASLFITVPQHDGPYLPFSERFPSIFWLASAFASFLLHPHLRPFLPSPTHTPPPPDPRPPSQDSWGPVAPTLQILLLRMCNVIKPREGMGKKSYWKLLVRRRDM
ncbi:chemokine-like protein TAFA-1 isoform X2 [Elephas maximus indicus]|uniref:chemokine-like protein TAFA-1 isoform X2 n=1 Tax=Elephas maximus indicus TaxID=99487 RepID=UPI002116D806|nr:chemokine-like protein TAFA-1 isoform X2 [Elephas maximus indicus]